MSFLHGRKKIAAIGAACLLFAAAGAYAYWTSTGAGTGSATHATYAPVTVYQTSTINSLYPGGAPVTLSGDFTNPNAGAVRVASVTVAFAATDPITTSGGVPIAGCTVADYELGGTAAVNAEIAGAPSTHVGSWTGLTIKMLDSVTNQDACKSATVHLVYTSS